MALIQPTRDDLLFMKVAYDEARTGYDEGGCPIGSVLVENGQIIARGHNRRVQDGDPIAHGEMDCLRRAGRRGSYGGMTIYTTLSPCMMCTGTIVQFGIPRVVVGEDKTFAGNIPYLIERGVDVALLQDPDCIALMQRFIAEKPELWNEDIAEDPRSG